MSEVIIQITISGNMKYYLLKLMKRVQTVADLLIYEIHYVFNKKLYLFLSNRNCNFVCRRCISSHLGQNVLIEHKQQCECEKQEIASIETSNESHLYWKKTRS